MSAILAMLRQAFETAIVTYGASDVGYRYAVDMFVAFEIAVHIARATPRFALGRGIEDEIQERMSWKIEKDPVVCRNIAK